MQTILHVMAKSTLRLSLRKAVIADLPKRDDSLCIRFEKKKGRMKGWAKITAPKLYGAINIQWDASSKTLTCRAVSKQGNHPNELVGRFVSYLLRYQGRRIANMAIRTV